MAKVVAKKKGKKKREISDAQVELMIGVFREQSEKRYKLRKIYDAQDDATKEIIDRMLDSMRVMAGKPYVNVKADGVSRMVEIPQEIQDMNFMYCAIKILVRLAEMDVQIGNFTLPKKFCAECGRKV